MAEVFRVNGWRVSDETTYFLITNVDKPGYKATYNKTTGNYSYKICKFTIPKTIDCFVKGLPLRAVQQSDKLSLSRTYGIEIECYHPSNGNIREDAAKAIREVGITCTAMSYTHQITAGWKIITDSSIRGGAGLEVVSPILSGEEGLEQIRKVMQVLSNLGCRVNKSTGTHIHHGANDLTSEQLHNVFNFYKDNEELYDSLVANSRRGDNNYYCGSLKRLRDNEYPGTRYSKVNHESYVKYGTIEFRQHQGTLNFEKIRHWIILTQRTLERAKSNKRFDTLENLLDYLGLASMSNWYLERAEELAA